MAQQIVTSIDVEALESWLDMLKPSKELWPEGITREHYLGALAAVETLGMQWMQLDNGQHLIFSPVAL